MKDKWRVEYQRILHVLEGDQVNILTGFNANIDLLFDLEDLHFDFSGSNPELVNPVESLEDLKSSLKYCMEKGENEEVDGEEFYRKIPGEGVRRIGGQAGIIANYLSGFNNYVAFHTPLLSEELAEMIDEDVVSPVMDGKLLLKRVNKCVNTDRTKKNTIIQFDGEKTGRLIVSDKMRGFGPYFRSGVEENFDVLEDEIDRMILSGFQNVEGNFEAKLQKSANQLDEISTEKHLEYVSMREKKSRMIFEEVLPKFDSVGMDETEAIQIAELMEMDVGEELEITEAYELGRELLEKHGLSRCHIHTYGYHVCVAEDDYSIDENRMKRAMLYGEACAIQMADQGEIPDLEDMKKFELDGKHLHRLDPLEKLGHRLEEDEFAREGVYSDSEVKVAAIPTLIHDDPERLVGMGDIISSGAFTAEIK
ncbi:MAG: ADP-dependent glucokinase/phosphofructokinase [Candidatus Nanosalina sp.]